MARLFVGLNEMDVDWELSYRLRRNRCEGRPTVPEDSAPTQSSRYRVMDAPSSTSPSAASGSSTGTDVIGFAPGH